MYILWTSNDDGIELGTTMDVFAAFADMGRCAPGEDDRFGHLFGLACGDGEDYDEQRLRVVAREGAAYLDRHGDKVHPETRRILELIAAASPAPRRDPPAAR